MEAGMNPETWAAQQLGTHIDARPLKSAINQSRGNRRRSPRGKISKNTAWMQRVVTIKSSRG